MRIVHSSVRGMALGLVATVTACSGAPDGVLPSLDGGSAANAAATVGTEVDGESFSTLQVGPNALSGVFVRGDRSLAFDVEQGTDASVLRLSTVSGDVLYSQSRGPDGFEMRVGPSFRSLLPQGSGPGGAPSLDRNRSPVGFESSGNLEDAFNRLKGTPIDLLPYLVAALGRVGLSGKGAAITMPLHMTALRLTKELGLKIDTDVVAATQEIMKAHLGGARAGTIQRPSNDSPPEPSGVDHVEAINVTPGGTPPPVELCPNAHPPCAPGFFAPLGCCIKVPTTVVNNPAPHCSSGAAREYFDPYGGISGDPCQDDCRGLCGPGCSPWYWVCEDYDVHTVCWNHDRASCPESHFVLDVIPNPVWVACEAEYGAYSAWIFTDTQATGMCTNGSVTDSLTEPWDGLSASFPDYYVNYR